MKRFKLLFLVFVWTNVNAQKNLVNYSANLPATDALGRKLPVFSKVKEGKYVGLFYWLWHHQYSTTNFMPFNISKFLESNSKSVSGLKLLTDYDNPIWPVDKVYFWSEPLFNYYVSTDRWVLRKHAEMLADAGVDVIFFDCTNGSQIWKLAYTTLCEVFIEARKDGIRTPQIAFVTALGPTDDGQNAINQLYNELYKPGLYKSLWFYWKGKPLLLGYTDLMIEVPGNEKGTQFHKDIKNFFTFRPVFPYYQNIPNRPDQWGWLQVYPQHGFFKTSANSFEEMPVGVAQNWSKERGLTAMNAPNVFGRSYTNRKGHAKRLNASSYGFNFQEQWDRALKQNVEFVFIVGWNEWIVGRHREWGKQANAFPDEYNVENSRDIEPMTGGFGDNYYYQLVANIRRFKGNPPEQKASLGKTAVIDGLFSEWVLVNPHYKAHKGSTMHRNSPGFRPFVYTNNSGRNDIVGAKVTCDDSFVYFYVETADKLTTHNDPRWMTLLIDVDRSVSTGWHGYDLAVNYPQAGRVEKLDNGNMRKVSVSSVTYAYRGNQLELRVPRFLLSKVTKGLNFEFKWTDNQHIGTDIIDFWTNGDVAPSGRYNYHYKEEVRF